ncbi:hypothetical protein BRARA_E02462 [Brassica rapa]|uniref:Uncharacterized protein n=1 Tax=Brassica campestris TaxID=3711 RepID=A0A397ZD71_BRACM|nr:hypothetical protein BRARA_E02462 [Brassica rapa]
MCSSKENISVDVIVRKKKLYELSEHFMEIDRSLEELTESLGVCLLLYQGKRACVSITFNIYCMLYLTYYFY